MCQDVRHRVCSLKEQPQFLYQYQEINFTLPSENGLNQYMKISWAIKQTTSSSNETFLAVSIRGYLQQIVFSHANPETTCL
jgi:hypothetical protein